MRAYMYAVLAPLTLAAPLAAQEPRTITYEQAIAMALQRNAIVQIAENAAASGDIAVKQQRMQFLPNLSLNTQSQQSVGRTFSADEGDIVNQTTRTLNAGVSSSVTLFNGFRNIAQLREAQLSRDASDRSLERARQTVVFTVSSNFLELVRGQEQLRVQREALAAQEAEEAQIKAFVDAGSRPIADLYQQQANVAAARAALVEAQRAWGLAELELMRTLQLDPRVDYEFVAPTIAEQIDSLPTYDVDALIARALEQRSDIDAQQARVLAAEQSVRAAGAGRWPSASLSAGYNTGASSTSDLALLDQFDRRRGGSIGLNISVPIFDRLSASTAKEQARLEEENERITLEEQTQEVAVQVRRAHLDFESAREQLRAAEAQERAAQLALDATRERYRVGVATLLEVTQARALQVQAASALVSARYNLVLQRTLIGYYVGDLDPENATFR